MVQIGLFGGTFDPIHWGHLLVAEAVREIRSLSRVVFIPAGLPWLKANQAISPAPHRLKMVELAIRDNPCFEVSTIEIDHPGPSYTVDTVASLRGEMGPQTQITFIAGSDALIDLSRWKEPEKLAGLCRIVGVRRPGESQVDMAILEQTVAGISARIDLIDVPQIDLSSTDIRRRVGQALSIRYRVPAPVADYIYHHKLYL